jgi:OFA family oxalate/formate antiporter-like MFS transporter
VEREAEGGLNRWAMIAIGFVIELVLGLLYAWSIFVLPLEQEFGWVRAQTSLAFSVSLIFFPAGMVVGGRLADRRGLRLTGSGSAILLSLGFLLTSFTRGIPWLVISYGAIGGFAIGAGTNCVSNLVSWFPDRRGLAAGVLSMGFALAGLVVGSATGAVIAAAGWRPAFRLLAAVALLVCLGGFQFLRKAPAGWQPAGHRPSPGTGPALRTLGEYTSAQMLRSSTFWTMELWFLLISTAGVMVIGHAVPMAVELGIAPGTAVLIMGTLSLANGVGRLLYGSLSDRLGRVAAMLLGASLMSLALWSAIPLTRSLGTPGLFLAMVLAGSSYGAAVPLATAVILQLFGARNFGTHLGIASCQIAIAGLLGPQMAGLLRTNTGSYEAAFALTGVLALAACTMALWFGYRLRRAEEALPQAQPLEQM